MGFYSEQAELINRALDFPEDWTCNEYRLSHKCGVDLWIGNGAFFFDLCGGGAVGLLERHFLYRKARRVIGQVGLIGLRNHLKAREA